MKYLIILCLIVLSYACSPVKQSQSSKKTKHYGYRQWMKQRSDGYWVVYTTKGFGPAIPTTFECKPDSIQLSRLFNQ